MKLCKEKAGIKSNDPILMVAHFISIECRIKTKTALNRFKKFPFFKVYTRVVSAFVKNGKN